MKICFTLLFILGALNSKGAATLGFTGPNNISEGWANSAGNKNVNMVWGILVDTLGDGFDGFTSTTTLPADGGQLVTSGASYDGGFNLTNTSVLPGGQLLSVGGLLTDDRLFISNNPSPVVGGEARFSVLATLVYDANMAAGDKYAIVWFDIGTLDALAPGGSKYGAWFKNGATSNSATILTPANGTYTDPSLDAPAGMWGADNSGQATKVASLTLVPEPSSALLGLLGAAALLRRRRR